MKRIAVMTDARDSRLGEILTKDLEEVFGGRTEIRNYFFESLGPGDKIDADVVLVTVQSKAVEVQSRVPEARRILVLQRTIREHDASRIFSIPPGTKVLVVNNLPENTLETVALLQQMEIHHLQFVPYEDGMDVSDIHIAITPGERGLVPPGIETVIDLGHRRIDISTFIEIVNRLKIDDREVERRLIAYSENNVNLDVGVNRQFKELYIKSTELDAVIDLARDGILLVNTEGRITLYNRSLAEMLGIREDLTGSPVSALGPEFERVFGGDQGREWIVEYRDRQIVVTKKEVQNLGEPAGSYFDFQEVTYIRQLEQNLSRRLREKGLTARYTFEDMRTESPAMRRCLDLARRIAGSDFTVLISGESGTGKELLAQSIHNASARRKQPFVAVNCAAVPESLLESELFGYEGGSFTGALREGKAGLFEQAHHGTVFLDEVGDMPPSLQAKLLRVLQERQIMRVGSSSLVSVNIRVIAATNHDLRERIRTGQFREDLFYRLNALSLAVPPLRERPEDIFPLLGHFLSELGHGGVEFSAEARELIGGYRWPGNIRELGNLANHVSLLAGGLVAAGDLPPYLNDETLAFERERSLLESRCGLASALPVLSVMARAAERKSRSGRKSIEEALRAEGGRSTEAEVRSVLKALAEAGLVRSSVGRKGSELTPRGQQFLNWLNNGFIG